MFTDIEIHRAAKLYVPQCRRSGLAGARSSLYKGLDSIQERREVVFIGISVHRPVVLETTSVSGSRCSALRRNRAIRLWPAVPEKLPDFANFGDHVEIKIRDHDFVFITAGL